MRRVLPATLLACALLGVVADADGASDGARQYVVVYRAGASAAHARAAIRHAGGRIVNENAAIGVATVRTGDATFRSDVARSPAVLGAAVNEAIGYAPRDVARPDTVEREYAGGAPGAKPQQVPGAEPLASLQWDMRMIHATPRGSYRRQQGSQGVRVGIIDTGVDASHPDIRRNFDAKLSRNFTVDDPTIDGDCNAEPDRSCNDPANVDEDGHGTHVASTIGAPLNGRGIGGIAPRVDLVNLRAGQDSGFFFLGPTVNALTYAANHGIDVVNMSFFIDPWLYNCRHNSADSPAEQREQRLIIEATQRAINFARAHGVTTIAALGNEATDLGNPTSDATSPDYPPDAAHERVVDNTCLNVPTETKGVISVSALGPSKRKAYYSDYGLEQTDVAAPGGDRREGFGTPRYDAPENRILAAYPKSVGLAAGTIDPATGNPTTNMVVKQGNGYYQWLQGTSMAAPHAVGVAALIVAQYGTRDRRHGGLTLAPRTVERVLRGTATDTPCPTPREFHYDDPTLPPEQATATCAGGKKRNGFYGDGIVDARRAVALASVRQLRR
jgi:lantibiotic leader peptide-processing serine protease